jgi:hypothetical protein
MNQFKPLPRKCKSCKGDYMTSRPMQSVCSPKCALSAAKVQREKTERKEIRAAKERIKSKADHADDAQKAFNEWVRLRDAGQPCISCGTTANVQFCAGHYRTRGACPELRFEPLNVHRQCNKNCNLEKSGNVLEYRIRLVQKIGTENLAWLEGSHEPKRYTIEDLKSIKAEYRDKTRQIKKQIAGECA